MTPVELKSGLSSLVYLLLTMLRELAQAVVGIFMSLVTFMIVYPVKVIWEGVMLLSLGLIKMAICLVVSPSSRLMMSPSPKAITEQKMRLLSSLALVV